MELSSLTFGEYSLVYNMLSFTIASMLAAGLFFILAQHRVAPKYRISLIVSTLVVGIAAYHYFRITGSWADAFMISETGNYVASGKPFNDAYRYVDWLLTVPLLLVELVLVLNLSREKSGPMLTKLVIAATLMIGLGYPGELLGAESMFSERGLWGFLSTIPFIYILWILFGELGKAMEGQPERVRVLFRNIRLLLIFTWGFYPIVYMAPFFGLTGSESIVAIQVGYTIADVLAKAGYGVMIYAIAREKSINEGYQLSAA
ncbi:bacteriorhodopsin-like [Rhodohalobacter sulfatireducens]|uniref:Bacteriorhodopsin-like n=1 Tax=Rhodohalobacter sulfatireducens TaxID=2911366 RepID=A0ABS9KB67_9BACT|nr:bacteriorhodopsin-like [Rhodohalobacter sulfatireducens]MCG2588109.1 bacteriorhodopsin-like [Rhodohalobacter sulfatireducens]